METLKVSAQSDTKQVAGAIAGSLRKAPSVALQAIGIGAVHRAVKAVVVARRYLAVDNIDIVCIPTFVQVDVDGSERTAVKIIVEHRTRPTE